MILSCKQISGYQFELNN